MKQGVSLTRSSLVQRGIGSLYVTRLCELQERILQDEEILGESVSGPVRSDFSAWQIPVNNVPEKYLSLHASLRNMFEVQTYAGILSICQRRNESGVICPV